MNRYDAVIVGSGLVGSALAYDLGRMGQKVLVLEMGSEIGAGASRTNSGILHTGFDSKPGELETAMIRAQAQRWPALFDQLRIPYRIPGAMLLARTLEEVGKLEGIAQNAAQNGVEVETLSKARTNQLEPHIASEAGLRVPGEAMTDPLAVMEALLAGAEIRLNSKVLGIEAKGELLQVRCADFSALAPFVINCAGLFGDELMGDPGFRIIPRRGEFLVFPRETAKLINHTILPIPSSFTKGILAFSTLYGYLCVGPTAQNQEDKTDWRPRQEALQQLWHKAAELIPSLATVRPVDAWAGLRPHGEPQTYRIEFSPTRPNLLHIAAIRSTGLSACLGLSQYAIGMLQERGLSQKPALPYILNPTLYPLTPWWQRHNALHGIDSNALLKDLEPPS